MNEELPASANRLPPCFFILHSAFFICFWKPTAATVPLKATVPLAQWAAAQNHLSLVTLLGTWICSGTGIYSTPQKRHDPSP
jgi:hypothetical protein